MAFTVTLQPSGARYACGPDTDLLRAGTAQGLALRYSCRSGVCRTCRGRVLQGDVDPGPVHPAYLSAAEIGEGWVHLCCARPRSDCTIAAPLVDLGLEPARRFPVRVQALQRLAADVMRVVLSLPPNEPLRFAAGQYLDVLLEDGQRRSYSIASAPTTAGLRQLELHVRHMPGGLFTDRVFAALQPRALLQVEAPLGGFVLDAASSKPAILLASGTGFAPVQAMVELALAQGLQRPLHVYWGGRRRADLYRDALAQEWTQRDARVRYTPVLSEPTAACGWEGRSGFVHRAVLQDHPSLAGHQVYACGAPAMVEAARRDFAAAGLPPEQFFADAFVSRAELAAA